MRGVKRQVNILGIRAGNLVNDSAGYRGYIVKIATVFGRDKSAADKVVVFELER